jgi:hypothetical protein
MWQRLLQDPAFRKAVKVRYQALRKDILSNQAINAYIDSQAKLLAPCTARHFEKYPELLAGNSGGGFNPVSMFAAYRVSSYEEEIQILKAWLADRLDFLDRSIERFDKDWEPRIQELKEIKMPQFNGGFPFPFPQPFPQPFPHPFPFPFPQ